MAKKLVDLVKATLAVAAALLILGFGIERVATMPEYAGVFVDDTARTYIALPCMTAWQRRASNSTTVARRTTAGEAYRLGYNPDHECRNDGGFSVTDGSLSSQLLEHLGVMSPRIHWWDRPYRTEEGVVLPRPGTSR